jgi:competence protein ComEA
MRHIFREYFTYTSRERNGVLLLLSLIILLLIFLGVSRFFVHSEKVDFSGFREEIAAAYKQEQADAEEQMSWVPDRKKDRVPRVAKLFIFDPNTASPEELEQLGLSPKQVKAVIGYRSKGGKFEEKEDFAKLHVINDELYASLEPYILIPERVESTDPSLFADEIIIDINTADSVAIRSIKGISPVLTKNILRLRNALGGFLTRQQLMEVRGMDEKKFDLLSSRITLDSTNIRKINVNTCTIEQLSRHPYISYNAARAIVNYRVTHGNYSRIEDIRGSDLVNEELYRKIAPYLAVE